MNLTSGDPGGLAAFEPLEPRLLLSASDLLGALGAQATQYNQAFYVYKDVDSGANHFTANLVMNGGTGVTFDVGAVRAPDDTCVRISWNGSPGADGTRWTSLGWEEPQDHYGESDDPLIPDRPYSLFGGARAPKGAKLVFEAKLASGDTGDAVQFGYAGAGDSTSAVRQWKTLTTDWATYSMDVSRKNLSALHLGFVAAANDQHDRAKNGITFYIDNIRYEWPRPAEGRLVQSYNVLPGVGTAFDTTHANTAYTYDQAVTIMALGVDGPGSQPAVADKIGAGLLAALKHDWASPPPDSPGRVAKRLYDAYMSGDPRDNQRGFARPSGWWNDRDPGDPYWAIHDYGLDAGNNAWGILGFVNLYEQTRNAKYLNAAEQIATWIDTRLKDPAGGFFAGWKPDGTGHWTDLLRAKSVEQNADIYAAFSQLSQVLDAAGQSAKSAAWHTEALHAGNFVISMYHDGHFRVGTNADGSANESRYALDAQTWTCLALGTSDDYRNAINWAAPIRWTEQHLAWKDDGVVTGFDFGYDSTSATDHAPDGRWLEGTAQMALVYKVMGDSASSQNLIDRIAQFQQEQGVGLVPAADRDGLSTGLSLSDDSVWSIYNRESIAATSWLIFAELGLNPLSHNVRNVAPVNAVPGAQSIGQGGTLVFSTANGNAISVSDVDAGNRAVAVTLTASHGTLALGTTQNLSSVAGNGTGTVAITGAIVDINAALNGLAYSAAAGYLGPDSLRIVTNDQGNTGYGGPQSDADSVALAVGIRYTVTSAAAVTYTDADGDWVTVSLKNPGTCDLYFTQAGSCDVSKIVLNGTTNRSSLTINVKKPSIGGGGRTTVQDVIVTEYIDTISGPAVDLLGSISPLPPASAGHVGFHNYTYPSVQALSLRTVRRR